MSKKVRKMANGGALSDILGVAQVGGPGGIGGGGGGGGGFGGGSATEGLGQVNQGSQTIGSALQKAQAANTGAAAFAKEANAAIGGGGGSIDSGTGGDPRYPLEPPPTEPPPTSWPPEPGPQYKKGGKVKAYAKGGRISLDHCGVSTHTPNKKSPSW